jgi:hypothetical protein
MLHRVLNSLLFHRDLLRLPPRVALFYWRARRLAHKVGDSGTLTGSAPPRQVAAILDRARAHDDVVEIGTGAAWTSIALALNNPRARVTTYDPVPRDVIPSYLALASAAKDRITFIDGPGEQPQDDPRDIGFLFIDGNHEGSSTVATFSAWRDRVTADGVVVFHDFDATWSEVKDAIDELGLTGTVTLGMFVWRSRETGGGRSTVAAG